MRILTYFLKYAMPPILGGLIGLFTNWLALQMLFRPYKPVYIGKRRLPLTPGIIPKRKPNLAHAIGKAVAEEVLTETELAAVFSSPQMKNKFVDTVMDHLYKCPAIGTLTQKTDLPQKISETLANKIIHAVMLSDMESMIATYGANALKNHGNNPLLSFLLNEKFLSSIGSDIAAALKNYLYQHGRELITPKIEEEIGVLTQKNGGELLDEFDLSYDKTKEILIGFYDRFTTDGLKKLLVSADVGTVIENKINAMDVKQIADLTFKVLNKEMKAVIYLGGLLGMLIGVINIFI